MSLQEHTYLTTVSKIYNRLSLQGLPEHETGLHEVSLEQIFIKLTLQVEQTKRFSHDELEQFASEDVKYKRSRLASQQVEKQPLSIADALHQHRRLIVLGAPGSGKTTLLRWLAVTFANRQQAQADRLGERFVQNRLPVMLELRRFVHRLEELAKSPTTFKLVEEIAKFVDEDAHFPDTDAAFIQNAFAQGQCLLLCDGLDEIADLTARQRFLEALSAFATHYPHNWCILTSRPHSVNYVADFQKTEIQPFSDEDLKQFIQHWYRSVSDPISAQAEVKALLAQIQERKNIRELARNPLLATIVAILYRSKQMLPQRRVELYAQSCEVLLEKWDHNKDIRESGFIGQLDWQAKLKLLSPVAYWLHQKTERLAATEAEIEALLVEGLRDYSQKCSMNIEKPLGQVARQFIVAIRDRSGLLQGRGDGTLEFMHRTFQEYLCARYIADVLSPEACLDAVMTHLHESWWQEVHLLVVGHLGTDSRGAKQAEQLLLAVLHVYKQPWRWLLPRWEKRRWELGLWFPRWQWQRRIAWLLVREFALAAQMFADCAPEGRTPAMTAALSNSVRGYFTEYPRGLFFALDLVVAVSAKYLPVNIKQEVATVFRRMLRHKNNWLRQSAAVSLGQLGQADEIVISALVQALQDENDLVREDAAKSLGRLGQADKTVISALVQALQQHEDDLVRVQAAWSLGQLGQANETVLFALVQALQDENGYVRWQSAESLVRLGQANENQTMPSISAQIWHNGNVVWSFEQLGQANETVLSTLVQALQDKDPMVRLGVVWSLGQLGQADKTVLFALWQALQDEVWLVGDYAAQSLIQLEQADKSRFSFLVYKDNPVYFHLGITRIFIPNSGQANETLLFALVQALQNKNRDVRLHMARNLGQLKQVDEAIISALVQALQDEDEYVRLGAAVSLGQLGQADKTVVSLLVQALQDESDYWMQYQAAESLGNLKIKDSIQLPQLLFALNRLLFSSNKDTTLNVLRNLLEGRQLPGYRWRSREKRRQFWHRLKYLSSKRIMLIIFVSIFLLFLPNYFLQLLGIIAIAFTILPPLLFPPEDKDV